MRVRAVWACLGCARAQRVLEQRVHNVLEHLLKDPGYLLDNPPPMEPAGGLLAVRAHAP